MPDEDAIAADDPDQAADRLERALERIASFAHRASRDEGAPAADAPDTRVIAGRLDTLIARLREALGSGGE